MDFCVSAELSLDCAAAQTQAGRNEHYVPCVVDWHASKATIAKEAKMLFSGLTMDATDAIPQNKGDICTMTNPMLLSVMPQCMCLALETCTVCQPAQAPPIPVHKLWDHLVSLKRNSFSAGLKRKSTPTALYPSTSSVCDELKKMKIECEPLDDASVFPSTSQHSSRALSAGNADMGKSKTTLDSSSLLDSPLQECHAVFPPVFPPANKHM